MGIVRSFASPIGSYFDIPHEVVCGTLIGISTRTNIKVLRKNKDQILKELTKYGNIGMLISIDICKELDSCCDYLVEIIENWIQKLEIPRLGVYGFNNSAIERVIRGTGDKNNPVILANKDINNILSE